MIPTLRYRMANIAFTAPSFSKFFHSVPVRQIFDRLDKNDLDRLPESLLAATKDLTTSFEINFFENRIVTDFKNKKYTIELPKVLVVISMIYAKNDPAIAGSGCALLNDRVSKVETPSELIQSCAHLFDEEFAKTICSLMGFNTSVDGLLKGINTLYMGRCILGLGKSMTNQSYSHVTHEAEFNRIVCLINGLGPLVYSPPIR